MAQLIGGRVIVGCCGFPTSRERYYESFDAVEIQQTFYRPPRLETALEWRESAPPDFVFCLMAWQLITHPPSSPTYSRLGRTIPRELLTNYGHFRPTREVIDAWNTTLERAAALKAEVIVLQSPPGFRHEADNLRNMRQFFSRVKRGGCAVAWEPHRDWPLDIIARLCQELDLVHCVDPFRRMPEWGKINYFRLHGISGYRHHYSDQELRRLTGMMSSKRTYVMFNNASRRQDAERLIKLIKADGVRS